MAKARTPQTLKAAVESMYRIRATESPPDAQGQRTVWHRGARGAELVSWVDATGRLTKQDFFLFEDIFRWERGTGLRTAEARQPAESAQQHSAQDLVPDADVASRRARLERAEAAIGDYTGDDKYLQHLRATIFVEAGAYHTLDDSPITSANEALSRPDFDAARQSPPGSSRSQLPPRTVLAVLGLGALVGLAVLAKLLLSR